ncbi:MAG: hypothetical protein GC192_00225 [Bacteroidetes bacterium]|nr:hypothetical protein [Bacteroidota bacterium]
MSINKHKHVCVAIFFAFFAIGVLASPFHFAETVFIKLKTKVNTCGNLHGVDNFFLMPPPPTGSISVQINAGSDDAEQNLATNSVVTGSNDLELVYDLVGQSVGMRFNGISIPKNAAITNAYIEFYNKTALSSSVTLTINGEASDNPSTFTTAYNNITGRAKTAASASWTPGNWATVNAAYQTSDISNIVQEIVNRSGWASGNSMVMLINTTSTNFRRAYSYEAGASKAPRLVVNYTLVEVCGNGIDDDGDGLIDGADLDCGTFCPTGGLSLERWLNIGGGSAVTDLTSNANYPNNPSETATLTSFDGPDNYADNYGTRVRGYVTPSETGVYSFNLTSDDGGELYLSTDTNPANKVLIASVVGYTGTTEYTKFSSQTSSNLTLVAGQNYYVELLHKDGNGGDHFQVYWKTPSNSSWAIVPGANLRPFGCSEICGNGIDDDGDGLVDGADSDCGSFCSTGKINLERWLSIGGTAVTDLTGNANYPNTPSESTMLTSFDGPDDYGDNFGQRARGYISPTQTGIYTFNLTCDDAGELYLSTDANPANKRLIASVAGWTNPTEYTKYASQTSYSILLQANRNYYVEVLNKESGGGDHFQVYWTTPSNASWTIIPGTNLRPYACTEICGNNIDDDGDGYTDCNCDLITNGEFDNGITGWGMNIQSGSSASGAIDNTSQLSGVNSGAVTISTASGTDWHIQVYQTGLSLQSGKTYTVSFQSKSTGSRTMGVALQQSVWPYTVYWAQTVTLSATGSTYTFDYPSTINNAGQVALMFNMGQSNKKVWIDKISITPKCLVEICGNGIDDDGNGLTDCADGACPLPSASISGTNTICNGASTTLTASGGGTYAWSTGATSAAISVTPATTTTYTVIVTNASGCTTSSSRTVTVNNCLEICGNGIDDDGDGLIDCADTDCKPGITITPSSASICDGANINLTATASGDLLCDTYMQTLVQYIGDVSNTGACLDVPDDVGTYMYSVNGNYTRLVFDMGAIKPAGTSVCVKIKSATQGVQAIFSGWILQSGTPESGAYTLLGTQSTVNNYFTDFCFTLPSPNRYFKISQTSGGPFYIDAVAVDCDNNGLFTYNWSNGSHVSLINVSPSVNTTYTVTVTNSSGCTATASQTVTVSNCNEICDNGIDDDGDGLIDGDDSDCNCTGTLTNLALGKTAYQTSTYPGGDAGKAIDGNTNGNWGNSSITHTNYENMPRWFVDLGEVKDIMNVRIWNRVDCCSDRLSNFYVFVSDNPFTSTDPMVTINQAGVWSWLVSNSPTPSVVVSPMRTGRYVAIQLTGANYLSLAEVEVIGCQTVEVCDNGIDDDGDGLVDCDDSDCQRITLGTPVVSACINQPLQDVATVTVPVSWTNAPANDQIEVSIYGQTERINTGGGATSPQNVVFTVPANGALNKTITAAWMINTSLCSTSTTFNSPAACSGDQVGCRILYLCGLDKPYDGDPWDHGFMAYLDEINGSNIVMPVLTKADGSGMGTYDVNNPNTLISIDLSNFELVVVSATTEGSIAPALVAALKSFSGAVLNSNYDIIDDLGMSSAGGGYQFQSNLYVDNSLSKEIYNFNNDINPSYSKVFTRGNYTAAADAYLWTNAGEQNLGVNGVYFVYSSADAMPGVAAGHGRRVYLGYHNNGLYANSQNGGALPAPVSTYFVPATHLTLEGKYYLDLAILDATKGCNAEICNNGIDDNDNGLVDCQETVCGLPIISSVAKTNANNCPFLNNGQITITAGGSNMEYSINDGASYQASNVFSGVAIGTYNIRVRNSITGCFAIYASNPVQITGIVCTEICTNGIDDDGDGLIDCLDVLDCKPTANAGTDVSICAGSSYTLSVSASGGTSPYTYTWDNGLGTGQSKMVTPLLTTTYNVTVSSAGGCTATDAITITVTPCTEICNDGIDNDGDGLADCADTDCMETAAPHLVADVYQTCPGTVFQEKPTFNDENIQNAAYSIYANPSKGTVSINYNGVFTYTPNGSICGADSFQYQVCNAVTGCCDHATVVLNLGDNMPPSLKNVPADITISCDDPIPTAPVVFGLDACPGIYVSYDEVNNQGNSGSCQHYTIVRTWTATDICGNTGTASQTITVKDSDAPEIFRVYTLANGKQLLAGVSARSGTSWRHIKYPISFNSTPLVFTQVVSNNSPEAVVTRIKNVDSEGFDLKIQEEENGDGIHANEQVAWMAIEPGSLAGENLHAGSISNVTQALKILNYPTAFDTAPKVIVAAQTNAEVDPIQVRLSNSTNTSTQLYLEEEQSKDVEVTHANEMVAYLATSANTITDENGDQAAVVSTVMLTDDWQTINLSKKYTKPVVIFGGQPTGNDPATIRVRNITPTSFEARIEEWEYLNGHMPHRSVSYYVVEGSVPAFIQNPCSEEQTPMLSGVNLFAVDNCDNQVSMDYTETSTLTPNGMIKTLVWVSADDCGNTFTLTRNDTCKLAAVKVKTNLYGAMIGNGANATLMRDQLRTKGLIPLTSPYVLEPNNLGASQNTHTLQPALLDAIGDDAIVDWVLVELQDPVNPKKVLSSVPCLLQRDGDVVTEDGGDIIAFSQIPEDNYNVFIKHRNHLGMITSAPVFLTLNNVPTIDYRISDGHVYNTGIAGKLINGKLSMWAGDFNNDNKIIYQGPANDIFTLFSDVMIASGNTQNLANYILAGYNDSDINMDGMSIYQGPNNDRSMVLLNTILGHPTNVAYLANFIVSQTLP